MANSIFKNQPIERWYHLKNKEISFVLVPCKKIRGKIITKKNHPPYGYHHILRVHTDGSYLVSATLEDIFSKKKAARVMRQLAGESPCSIQSNFYDKIRPARKKQRTRK